MKSLLATAIISCVLLLNGCSGGDNGSEPECSVNSSCLPPRLAPAESVVGLWDRSRVRDEQQEILYTFIGADGEYSVYDFEQDDFGSGENCHTRDTGIIYRFTESSNYTLEFRTPETDALGLSISSGSIFLEGQNLNVRFPERGIEEIWTPINELATTDLILCE